MSTEEWWKHQFAVKNNKVMPLFSWSQQSKDNKPIRIHFDVTKTTKEIEQVNVESKLFLEQSKITEDVLQKYWSYFK